MVSLAERVSAMDAAYDDNERHREQQRDNNKWQHWQQRQQQQQQWRHNVDRGQLQREPDENNNQRKRQRQRKRRAGNRGRQGGHVSWKTIRRERRRRQLERREKAQHQQQMQDSREQEQGRLRRRRPIDPDKTARDKPHTADIVGCNLRGCKSEERLELLTASLKRLPRFYAGGFQETWRFGSSTVELDGITFVFHGRNNDDRQWSSRGSGGVAIALSTTAAAAWKRTGRNAHHFGDRWVAVHLQEVDGRQRNLDMWIIAAWAPVSSAPAEEWVDFFEQGTKCLHRIPEDHAVVLLADGNGALGTEPRSAAADGPAGPFEPGSAAAAAAAADGPVGPFGIERRNASGDRWRNWLGLHHLCSPATFSPNRGGQYGTWQHPKTGQYYQNDHTFIRHRDRKTVRRADIRAPIIPSDHQSTTLRISIAARLRKQRPKDKGLPRFDTSELLGQDNVEKAGAFCDLFLQHHHDDSNPDNNNIHQAYENIAGALAKTATELLPRERRREERSRFDYRGDEIIQTADDIKQHLRRRGAAAYEGDGVRAREEEEGLREKRKLLQKHNRGATDDWHQDLLKKAHFGSPKDSWYFLKLVKAGPKRSRTTGSLKLDKPDGTRTQTDAESTEVFRQHLTDLYERPEQFDPEMVDLVPQHAIIWDLADPPSRGVVLKCISRLRDTTPGSSGLSAALWQAACSKPASFEVIYNLVVEFWKTEEMPGDLEVNILRLLPKKGDLHKAKNYRGVMLREVFAKLFGSIMAEFLIRLFRDDQDPKVGTADNNDDDSVDNADDDDDDNTNVEADDHHPHHHPQHRETAAFWKKLDPATTIKLDQRNPKLATSKSHTRYEGYKDATTIEDFIAKGGDYKDLAHDSIRGFLTTISKEAAEKERSRVEEESHEDDDDDDDDADPPADPRELDSKDLQRAMESQYGFRRRRGGRDADFITTNALASRRAHGLTTWILYIDFVKAFDRAVRTLLWKWLARLGAPDKLIRLLKAMHARVNVIFEIGEVRAQLQSLIGVLQGDTLAPTLYIIYKACVLIAWRNGPGRERRGGISFESDREIVTSWKHPKNRRTAPTRFRLDDILFADDIGLFFESRTDLEHDAPRFAAHCSACGLEVHRASKGNPESKSTAVCHPAPPTKLRKGDELLNDDGTWIFYGTNNNNRGGEGEEEEDESTVRSHYLHRQDEAVNTEAPHDNCIRASAADSARWRRNWINENDTNHKQSTLATPIPVDEEGGYFPTDTSYVHLGSYRHGDGQVGHTVKNRLAAAHKFFGAARSIFRSRWASRESKTQLYIGAVLPTLLFGCESWLLDPGSWQKLRSFHHYCVRSMCRLNRLQVQERSIDSTQLLRKLRLQPIEYYIHRRQLRWFGDIARMHPSRLPRKMLLARPLSEGITPPRPPGRPRPTAESTLQAALEWANINPSNWATMAQDATEWRSTVDSIQPIKPLNPKRRKQPKH
jgi:hypothetical protein